MRYVLLTWNPGPDNAEQYTPEQWLDAMVLALQAGEQPEGNRWSIGTNWHVIAKGELVCMLRQGVHGRGIVATGVVTTDPFTAAHWDKTKSGDTHYVNVAWGRAIPLNEMITLGELEERVPGFPWNQVYSSGRTVEGEPGDALAVLLGQGEPKGKSAKKGQQFGSADTQSPRRTRSNGDRDAELRSTRLDGERRFSTKAGGGTWRGAAAAGSSTSR